MAALACVTLGSPAGPEVERKFVADRLVVRDLLAAVAGWVSPVVYDRARPVAYSRTTYLDTDRQDYFRSGDGRDPIHVRLRIREYAAASGPFDDPVLTGRSFLELKENVGAVRRKVRFAAAARTIERIVKRPAGAGDPSGLSPLIARRLRQDRPEPRVTTWYRRASFADAPERVRITIDDAIRICKPSWPGQAGTAAEPPDTIAGIGGLIVELKYSGDPPDWLARAVAILPPANRLSKFALAMTVVGQSLLAKRNG